VPTGLHFVFEPFELDPARRRLTASGQPVAISERQLDVLLLLVARAGQIVSKGELLEAGWSDVAVGDNSLEQAISSLRRLLGAHPAGTAYVETVPRRGYRFAALVVRRASRESDGDLDALLAPHRAFMEGRAALETLEGKQIAHARQVFERAVQSAPEHASSHIGLANSCIMQFEMSRTNPVPDTDALTRAVQHAREACRLDPQIGEAWATLGFVIERTGNRADALAASQRAVSLEPDNWRHHLRLASVSWGEERLRAAHRTLALLPGFPLAHWLAATVHVARQLTDEAERELTAALTAQAAPTGDSRFSLVALHWLRGLLFLARGDETRALEEFERELSLESSGHLYTRECCANTWYAIGALRLRKNLRKEAAAAFTSALERVGAHPMARLGLMTAAGHSDPGMLPATAIHEDEPGRFSIDSAMFRAARLVLANAHAEAATIVEKALTSAAPGNPGWLLSIEPLLHVSAHPEIWARTLAHVRNRAA
jgi:DNA-binding winged helix-turn-helix (wHTH) protein